MKVKLADGTSLGTIGHSFSCYRPVYHIKDPKGVKVMKIKGSGCGDCCIAERICGKDTIFQASLRNGGEVGYIRKHYAEIQESLQRTIFLANYDDVDECAADFPRELEVELKALYLAAIFLINFMYFDEEGQMVDVGDHEADFLFREGSAELENPTAKDW